jgi:phosphatidylinositol glycan class B
VHPAKELDGQLRASSLLLCISIDLTACTLLADMPRTSDSARDTKPSGTGAGAPPRPRPNSYRDSTLGIFALLLAFRIVNALALRTFFQPDEFFQSLEPAWQLAFGADSNAWITWVNSPMSSAQSAVV